jgi:hypothetical protein
MTYFDELKSARIGIVKYKGLVLKARREVKTKVYTAKANAGLSKCQTQFAAARALIDERRTEIKREAQEAAKKTKKVGKGLGKHADDFPDRKCRLIYPIHFFGTLARSPPLARLPFLSPWHACPYYPSALSTLWHACPFPPWHACLVILHTFLLFFLNLWHACLVTIHLSTLARLPRYSSHLPFILYQPWHACLVTPTLARLPRYPPYPSFILYQHWHACPYPTIWHACLYPPSLANNVYPYTIPVFVSPCSDFAVSFVVVDVPSIRLLHPSTRYRPFNAYHSTSPPFFSGAQCPLCFRSPVIYPCSSNCLHSFLPILYSISAIGVMFISRRRRAHIPRYRCRTHACTSSPCDIRRKSC